MSDAPEPVAAVGAGNAAVAAACAVVDRSDPELWVPGDASFRALLDAVSRAPSGSGWPTWQPFEDDDTIHTDMLLRATPYPDFPIGPDEPWIDAAVAKAALPAIPLRYVVSPTGRTPSCVPWWNQRPRSPLMPLPPQEPTSSS
ncbi:hypothetical protein [Saccharothrix australiensis]|uniref:Uncharacterized protein n=1 Tax=Saccharothrix australiensis TaxID=2072 RepID=A0A495W1G7_9PSEU|nr:hypothetical protein [Saccharothrix australiensis]RKT55531.1 hypothetical protein C8E97_4200 [Saccharothrix australiensis]